MKYSHLFPLFIFFVNMVCISPLICFTESLSQEAFEEIYRLGIWGKDPTGYGNSGGGSSIKQGMPFIHYLMNFLNTHSIESIVDLGCGDWVLAKEINWGDREYLGIDVVKPLIEKNQAAYTKDKIHFLHLDAAQESLPTGDLLICKDVMQHLSNSCIDHILSESKKFKYCLFVNDIDPLGSNIDTEIGGYRPLDLTLHPFNIQTQEVILYTSGPNTKQILFIANEN